MIEFKVKKGKKYFRGPRWNFFAINKKEFNLKICFLNNCIYNLVENNDQINKLFGHSYNILPYYNKEEKRWRPGHHKNSVRFGWRCINESEIELMAYVYIHKNNYYNTLLTIKPMQWVHLNFKETKCCYVFNAVNEDGNSSVLKFEKPEKSFINLFITRLYPYFGGKISAPHNMRIKFKYLKKFI